IGSQLIEKAHQIARSLGHRIVVLIGHEQYYPRFGYQIASAYQIAFPFEVPDPNAMVLELVPGALEGVQGVVVYPEAFFSL
ncbi:MAG: N-acetyltransferase, partial [Bacteroidota bacterium]